MNIEKSGGDLYLEVAEGVEVQGSPGHKHQQVHCERHLPQRVGHRRPPSPRNLLLRLAQESPQELRLTSDPPFSRSQHRAHRQAL